MGNQTFIHVKPDGGGSSMLRMRVGLVYYPEHHADIPQNLKGVVPFSEPLDPYQKFYLFPSYTNITAGGVVECNIPPVFRAAPIWELLLNKHPSTSVVLFGRHPSERHPEFEAFTFDNGPYMPLSTHEGNDFNTLYMVIVVDRVMHLLCLRAKRTETCIQLELQPVGEEDLPPCLKQRLRDAREEVPA